MGAKLRARRRRGDEQLNIVMRCQLRGDGGDGGQGHLRNHNRTYIGWETLKMSPSHPIVLLSFTSFLMLMR